MKKITPFALMTLFLVVTIRCSNNEYPVQVKFEDGIRMVQNPKFPKFKDHGYRLEEVFTIGLAEGDNNYIFHRIMGIDVDLHGSIYVLDTGNYRIQVFDKEGKFLRTIGRKGLGPGELDMPLSISLGVDGNLFVMEYNLRKVTCFSKEGEFLKEIKINEGVPMNIHVHKKIINLELSNLRFPTDTPKSKPKEILELVKVDENGHIIKKIDEFARNINILRVGNLFYPPSKFEPQFVWTMDLNGNIYVGYGNKYEINMYDTSGVQRIRFGRSFKPSPVSHKERNEDLKRVPKQFRDKLQVPEVKPIFNQIVTDDHGNIWVHLFEKDENGFHRYDVFSADGIYLKKVLLKDQPVLIKNSFAYVVTKSQEGFPIIKKYQIKILK